MNSHLASGRMKASSIPVSAGSVPTIEGTLPGFEYQPLTRLVAGPGALSRLGELARKLRS